MGRCLLVLLLTSAAALAQQPTQGDVPKLSPNRERALDNALRRGNVVTPKENPFASDFKMPLLSATLLASSPPRQPAREISTKTTEACAIPLTRVPINPEMDQGIRHELKLPLDNMPTTKGLPVCPER